MHTYSTDNDLRPKVVGYLGIASFLLVLGIRKVLSMVNAALPFGAELTAPATGAVFTVVYLLFAKQLWKHRLLRRLGIVKTPYFSGTWEGYIQSSYYEDEAESGEPEKTDVTVEIDQNWRKMSVQLDGPDSYSWSLGSSVVTRQGRPQLIYYYLNKPDFNSPETLSMDYGTTLVDYLEGEGENGEDILDGIYYTGPERESQGKIHLVRVSCD